MNVNSAAVYKPKIDTALQRQILEVRKEQARRYAERQKENQAEGSATPESEPSSQPVASTSAPSNGGGTGKRKLVDAGSDDDVEFVGSAKKTKTEIGDAGPRLFRNEATRFPTPRFPKPRLLLTRTPGRATEASPTHLNNTINFREIMGPRQGRDSGIKSAWFYAFFIANEEFFRELPLESDPLSKVAQPEIYVGRDIKQDFLAPELAQQLGIPFGEANGNKPLAANDYRRLTTACTEAYRKMLGEGYHACYPPTSDSGGKFAGCAHSKFGLVQFSEFMRVFITSSNFMNLDFVYSDNHWFVVDLPALPKKRRRGTKNPEFEQELLEHATLLGCPSSFIKEVYGMYDYSSVEDKVKIVTSVPGSHSGKEALMYGALRLREVVRPFVEDQEDLSMEICTASIGGMQHDWLRSMYHAFTGGKYDNEATAEVPPRFRITYPTRSDVDAARSISKQGASQIGCHTKWGEADQVIKDMFHHYRSRDQAPGDPYQGETGQGCLFHQKFYMAMPDGTAVTDTTTRPLWIYLGSANFTKAAWGKICIDKRKAKTDPGCRRLAEGTNFEMGIVVAGDEIESMLEPGSVWHDLVPHERNGAKFTKAEKPYNSEAWVKRD